jgi:hypothetical protein
LIALFSLSLIGCASTPVPVTLAKTTPNDRVLAFQDPSDLNNATITITRDKGFLGGGCYAGVYIDMVLVARLGVGEAVTLYLAPGEKLLRVGRDPEGRGLCGLEQSNWTQRETLLKANDRKSFRMTIDANHKYDIFRSDI